MLVGNADCFPQLIPDQILKLKQLTVLTLAETYKVLPIRLVVIDYLVCIYIYIYMRVCVCVSLMLLYTNIVYNQ